MDKKKSNIWKIVKPRPFDFLVAFVLVTLSIFFMQLKTTTASFNDKLQASNEKLQAQIENATKQSSSLTAENKALRMQFLKIFYNF